MSPLAAFKAATVVPLACAISPRVSPALTVTVPLEDLVLFELEVVLVVLEVFEVGLDWLEPGNFRTCPSFRLLLMSPLAALRAATVVPFCWAIPPSVSPDLTVTVPLEDFAVALEVFELD